jgi:acetolactate synthase-1/2/3 large subunit
MNPSEAVVAGLRAHGVELFFGLDGDHVIYLFNALMDAPDIRPITVKHENNAAIAAEVYGRLTGRPGVCITTAGPGATNALSGVAGAYAAGVPLVHISGGVPQDAAKEAFHGVDDPDFLLAAFTPVTKWSCRIEDAREIPAALDRAFSVATSGRPGPVHVEVAMSALLQKDVVIPASAAAAPEHHPAAHLDTLIERINGVRSVAIVAGKNAWWPDVSAQLVRVAERLAAPVAHTWDGHAAMPTVHPLSVGVWRGATGSHPTAYQLVDEADIILGIGVRRGTEAARGLAEQVGDRLVILDATDAPEGFEASSIGGLVQSLDALAEECRARDADATLLATCAEARRLQQCGIDIEMDRYRDARPWHIGVALDALARQMTPDILVISDVSMVKLWTPLQIPAFNPESHVQPGSWGAMGYAVPGVLAAGLVRPEKKVVGVTGDTSFQMACSDFGTICQLGLPVVVAVHADGQIGMIDMSMKAAFNRSYATEVGRVDFVKYAEAFGARGIRVDDPADCDAAWKEALVADGPVLLELRAGHGFPSGWPVSRLVQQAESAQERSG